MDGIWRFTSTASVATAAAFLMIAFQTAGKAARDGFFLSSFSVSRLPSMVILAAVASLAVVMLASRLMTRMSTARFVPLAFLSSGGLMLGEWALQGSYPRAVSVLIFLHVAVFGPVLASGFWALVSESFDPRAARRSIAGIGVGGTAGGLVGGLVTGGLGAAGTTAALLPLLAMLHLACWALTLSLGRSVLPVEADGSHTVGIGSVFEIIRWTPHLRSIGGLVLCSTAAAAFLDFTFKSQAGRSYPDPADLVAFFAYFYTGAALLTFLVQITVARVSIERLGLGKTAGSLPLAMAAGQLLLLSAPGLFAATAVRGAEMVLRSSVFRSAYELFFSPVRVEDKRRTKLLLDVGADRLGDAMGGALLVLLLGLRPSASLRVILLVGATLAAGAVYLAFRLQRTYVSTLSARLMSGAVFVPTPDPTQASRLTLFQSMLDLPVSVSSGDPETSVPRPEGDPKPKQDEVSDWLSSDLEEHVRAALDRDEVCHPANTPRLIRLLAWDSVAPQVASILVRLGHSAHPHLTAGLADPQEDFVIRRRIPGILSHDSTQESVDALLAGADDQRFEVRYRVAVALRRIRRRNPELQLSGDRLADWILRELSVERLVWQSRKPLEESHEDTIDSEESGGRPEGADRSLRHVFNLLELMMSGRSISEALTGLQSGDARLRGTALEYLESVLPEEIREKLLPYLVPE
ncbi:MAG: hypothetical protein EHM61_13730 [Acidobacteria bacterium]|nr:MAG: hypothetical protein EHM61_13730 [Acidobacteriota bacterium]